MIAVGRFQKIIFVPLVENVSAGDADSKQNSGTPQAVAKRVFVLDVLRGVAALQVVITHSGSLFTLPEHSLKLTNTLTRYEVPLFLIISGALLIRHGVDKGFPAHRRFKDWSTFWSAKLNRVFAPYFFCCLFIALYYQASLSEAFFWFLSGDAATPYYFIPILFQCYLLFFLFPKFFTARYCLPIAVVLSFADLIARLKFPWLNQTFFCSYFIYFCYGCCHFERISKGRGFAGEYLNSIITLLLLIISFFILMPHEYYNFNFFYSIAVFELLLATLSAFKESRVARIFNYLGTISLWIFLTHFAVIRFLFDYFALKTLPYPEGWLLVSLPMIIFAIPLAVISQRAYESGSLFFKGLLKK